VSSWWDEYSKKNEPKTSTIKYPPHLTRDTRWPRFFARIFDLWWETPLAALLMGSFLFFLYPELGDELFYLMCLPVALFFDAVVYTIYGNTPGKALLRVKVVNKLDGSPLIFSQYLGRNLKLWIAGLAFGLPLFNIFTMARQAIRLGKGQPASYDEFADYQVQRISLDVKNIIAFGVCFVALVTLIIVGSAALAVYFDSAS